MDFDADSQNSASGSVPNGKLGAPRRAADAMSTTKRQAPCLSQALHALAKPSQTPDRAHAAHDVFGAGNLSISIRRWQSPLLECDN
jgi:hypothetical protein